MWLFFSKVRIQFLPFALPYDLFWKLRIEFLSFCLYSRVICFFKVRAEFFPISLHYVIFCEVSKVRVLTIFLTLRDFFLFCFVFLSKNRVLTFCPTMFFFVLCFLFVCLFVFFFFIKSIVLTLFLIHGIFFKVKNEIWSFILPCDFFWKVRIQFLPFTLPCDLFFSKVRVEIYSLPYPWDLVKEE